MGAFTKMNRRRRSQQQRRGHLQRKRRELERIQKFGSGAIVQRRVARSTGTTVIVEDTHHWNAQCDSDGGRWATVCEDHGGVVNHEDQATARSFAAAPEEWCPDCQRNAGVKEELG